MAIQRYAASGGIALAICLGAIGALISTAAIGRAADGGPQTSTAVEAGVLNVPTMTAEGPAAGRRVRQTAAEYAGSDVHHSLYLPPDWSADWKATGKRWPVIVEYTGNFAPGLGSTGEVANAGLGFGLSGGQGYIWIVMPYVAGDHRHNERTWWGDEEATVAYCKTNLPRICEAYGGDRRAVVLCGFSRGAIGVNYIGLHDDQIARLWTGFVTHDHYDGVLEWKGQPWGSPLAKYQAEARKRLARLGGRRVLVCQNGPHGTEPTRRYIGDQIREAHFTFLDVPVKEIFPTIPNPWFVKSHTDRWLLRDSPWRRQVWQWMAETVSQARRASRVGPSTGVVDRAAAASQPAQEPISMASLRAAIEDLTATFGKRYPRGGEYLRRLADLQRQATASTAAGRPAIEARFEAIRREALIGNPLVSGQPIVFVVHKQYKPDHHNTETMFQTGEINTAKFEGPGALKTIDLATGRAVTLLDVPTGVVRDPEVSFDGRKILFSMRRDRDDDYHLYEIRADGSGLRQLTFGRGLSDIDPIYLPDGRICFTSTREPKYCMCNRHIMGNLHTMDADGTNLLQIGHDTLHEGHASLLPDGRILYDRWEYVDRNFGDAQGVWTVNPDGTHHAIYWKNNTNSPGAVLEARAIPGTEQFVCVFSSCHDRPWGALAIVDRRLGLDLRRPVVRTWPPAAIDLVGLGNYDTFKRVQPKYENPYPLSGKHFLCSRMTGQGEEMGIYLVDTQGNEILLHAESPGCFDPMPLAPRAAPPVIPPRVDLAKNEGYFYVADVYRGAGMEQIERGTVKRLRVVESPEKRFWTGPAWDGGTGTQAPGMAWNDFANKRILGSVPVAADGSAYFAAPADRFVYFQLLDAEGRMLQSMRSGTMVRPGETSGCAGCHEDRRESTPGRQRPASMQRGPSRLEPWYGPPRLFSYTAEVQPVFDKHCVACHDYGKPAGAKLNLAGDLGLVFNTSYIELRGKNYVHVVGAGPFQVQMPKSWGSHASRLTKYILDGHGVAEIDRQVRLNQEAIDRVLTWIDINAPYYPDYAGGAFRNHPYGRSPLDQAELKRLGELLGANLLDRKQFGQINFTRPELSPCLTQPPARNDPRCSQAISIIRRGQERLSTNRRPDMPGFRLLDPVEIEQEQKYQSRLAQQARTRAAIASGHKRFQEEK